MFNSISIFVLAMQCCTTFYQPESRQVKHSIQSLGCFFPVLCREIRVSAFLDRPGMKQAGRRWLQGHRLLSAFQGLSPCRADFVLAPHARLAGTTDSKTQSTSLYITVAPGVVDDFTFVKEIFTPQKSVGKQLFYCSAFSYQAVNEALHSSRNSSHVANSS